MAVATAVPPTNIVSGKILAKGTADGVANVLVELFDLDNWPDPESQAAGTPMIAMSAVNTTTVTPSVDVAALYKLAERVGSVITDSQGGFRFELTPRDFNLPGKTEQRPDLILVVLAPDEPGLDLAARVLHVTRDIYLNAGSSEAYIIRLPAELLAAKDIAVGGPVVAGPQSSSARVTSYINARESDREFNTGVADYHAVEAKADVTARQAFRSTFVPSITTDLSTAALPGIVLAPGDDIRVKNAEVFGAGIVKANTALAPSADTNGVPVNLYLTPDDRTRLAGAFGAATDGYADVPDSDLQDVLFRTSSSDNPGTLLINANPIALALSQQSGDELCAKEHIGLTPPSTTTGDGPATDDDAEPTLGNADIPKYLARLIQDMPTPDIVLQPAIAERRATQADLATAIANFSLPKGPAEMPATYFFNSLQVAFDHVWHQLFDETLPDLAFTANTLGYARFGIENLVSSALLNGGLKLAPVFVIAPVEVPAVIAKLFDVTKDEYNELPFALRSELLKIATAIDTRYNTAASHTSIFGIPISIGQTGPSIADLRVIQALTEQGERLIDSVRHDDNYTLHKTLKDLNDRLSGAYEFTVFAADKDHHSVNFGLLNTYQQDWTPLAIQPGKLVKTIPLAPKEERKYSVKSKRGEKRSTKQARRNNTSITEDMSSTSRVESEIMAKAQTKTTFGLTAEGDYDIGLASGKSTTTFGVEAINESAQNRKDFREAVMKAVEEYKQEVSTEVSVESDVSEENEQSGTITNPNDELAVTYLFYELQKRYRLSEQLYRVMPVVLVAQQVPSPDQITPAWVLSNDWILRRYLLDDSFKPALDYIANKSVGDDFSLREMRKNLRQQRNLVETLRIEFSAASIEADNRYKALETAISKRIDEEHAERTDGFGSDFLDFFGGGGQDPEAAKARELAAKDAQQYAQEKAEKANVALRQEMNTLQNLTDAYNKTLQVRLDNETRVKRLLVHIRNNMLYYMQAIWSLEPPDQRYLRLHKVDVPILELESRSYRVAVDASPDIFAQFRAPGTEKHKAFQNGTLKHNAANSFDTQPLVEIADLDSLQGFLGNYMVFTMRAHNALTEFMAAPYVDSAFGAMDPDELSNVSLEQYSRYICSLHAQMSEADFDALKPQLKAWLEQLLASPLRNGDEIVVPSGGLFIETLVDPNPILENFKLLHRELDVFKAQEDVRKAGLENLRLAARLLNAEREDPDIDRQIVVRGASVSPAIDVDNP